MKYFVYKLEHDKGTTYGKTSSSSVSNVLKSIMDYELCPPSAVKVKEVSVEGIEFLEAESDVVLAVKLTRAAMQAAAEAAKTEE